MDPFGLESEDSDGWSIPGWLSKAIVVAAAAVTIVAATVMTVSTYGAGSVLGVAMISTAVTMAARATEVSALQIKKGIDDGKNAEQIAKDTVSSIYNNGAKIIGILPVTKPIGVLYNVAKSPNPGQFVGQYTLYDALGSTGGKLLPALATAWNVSNMMASFVTNDPVSRAEERGYRLK